MNFESDIQKTLQKNHAALLAASRIPDMLKLAGVMSAASRMPDMSKLAVVMSAASRIPDMSKLAGAMSAASRIPDMLKLAGAMSAASRMPDMSKLAVILNQSYQLQKVFCSITADLAEYSPDVQSSGNSLIIDGQELNEHDLSQIHDDFFLSEEGILACDSEQAISMWQKMPLPARIIVWIFLSFYLAPIFNAATENTAINPDKVARQIVRCVEQQFKAETPSLPSPTRSAFVTRWEMAVYSRPKRKSQVVGHLFLLQEVDIIQFRKKKRWLLVAWQDDDGEQQQGWVLGRYIHR